MLHDHRRKLVLSHNLQHGAPGWSNHGRGDWLRSCHGGLCKQNLALKRSEELWKEHKLEHSILTCANCLTAAQGCEELARLEAGGSKLSHKSNLEMKSIISGRKKRAPEEMKRLGHFVTVGPAGHRHTQKDFI